MSKPAWSRTASGARSSESRLRFRFFSVFSFFIYASFVGTLALVVAVGARHHAAVVVPKPLGQGFATEIANDYLSGRPTTEPVAAGVDQTLGHGDVKTGDVPTPLPNASASWSGYDTPPEVDGRLIEIHHFRVHADSGDFLLDITLVFGSDSAGNLHPVLAALPTVTPVVDAASSSAPALDYTGKGFVAVASNRAVIDRKVHDWVTAFTTGDSNSLADIAGSTNSAAFQGLSGFTADPTKAQVKSVALDAAPGPNYAIARVEIPMTRGQFAFTSDYDLLIRNPGGDPSIVSWGVAGSGVALTDPTVSAATPITGVAR